MLVKTLPKLAQEASDSTLASAIEKHLAETEGSRERGGRFEALGEQPKAEKCPGIEGHQKGARPVRLRRESEPGRLDMFLTGAAARTEHYEIAAYTGLITMAEALGETRQRRSWRRTSSRRRRHSRR